MVTEQLVQQMKTSLGTVFAFYLKAHSFHWNITGPNFPQYHEFFGNLYEEVYSSIDHMAEEIRAIDSFAPGSLGRMKELSKVQDQDVVLTPKQMIDELIKDNQIVIDELTKAFELADSLKEHGLADFLAGRLDNHKKHAWMLKSTAQG